MATRRASNRLSGGVEESKGGDNKLDNGRKRSGAEEVGDGSKKRKKDVKKQPSFKPQPVLHNSSDTPPEDLPVLLPPPPSGRKIARRRESTRAIRERVEQSPSPSRGAKRQKLDDERDDLRIGLAGDAGSLRGPPPKVDFLTFSTTTSASTSTSARARPGGARPTSPPSMRPPSGATSGSMAPPPFIKRTRKSLRGLGLLDRSEEEVVPVPDRETPMIRKNKELREAQSRRSSLGMRGQRASSSLGRGDISIPHTSVDSKMLYKHVTPTLPEPIRARHLLVWCAKRATDSALLAEGSSADRIKGKSKTKTEGPRTEEGDRLVKDIMEDLMGNLGKGNIDTNVFGPPGTVVQKGMPLHPHPRNVSNRKVAADITAVVKRCKEEENQWTGLINRANRKQADTIEMLNNKKARDAEPNQDGLEHEWMREAFELADGIVAEGEGDLVGMGEFADVEFKVDSLLQTSHRALQYSLQAQRFLDGIFSSLVADLRIRDRLGLPASLPAHESDSPDPVSVLSNTARASSSKPSASTVTSDPIHLLRALAAAEAVEQKEETVTAAAKVAPVPANLSLSTGPGAGGVGVGQTPRRGVGQGMTPRRTGGLGTTPGRGRVLTKSATPGPSN
ncbi:Mis12-Mtw1 protein family-domain-containing protein [Naematelia encephala]|uniref:Mis12-Mtw1 protein family-domain-containing protein n=1 Tax=Naematelia encephala TaxID=71784 RepID=A0A1Y2BLN9_9TREE|nr:Mis12-Mtw1 protein family-domain-containing protein [Naematelia encephala]